MEDAVGYLANVVPLRFYVEAARPFMELCRATNLSLLEARENAVLSAGEIIADLNIRPDPSRAPLAAIAFSHMHKYEKSELVFAGCAADYHLNPRAFEAYEVSLNVIEASDGLELLAHANSSLYSLQWLSDRLSEFEAILRYACASPGATIINMAELPNGDVSLPIRDADAKNHSRPGDSAARILDSERVAVPLPSLGSEDASSANKSTAKKPSEVIVEAPIIVTLQRGSPEKSPLLCLFGIQLYMDIATAIDNGTTVVEIHVPMLYEPGRIERPSLSEVASHYLDAVRKARPVGPYRARRLLLRRNRCLRGGAAARAARRNSLASRRFRCRAASRSTHRLSRVPCRPPAQPLSQHELCAEQSEKCHYAFAVENAEKRRQRGKASHQICLSERPRP